MVDVSIVIPSYNAEAFIERTVASALGQTVAAEVIVVDDGSTDGTRARLQALEQRHSGLRVISQSNGGDAVARGTGLKQATAPFIIFLDHDDLLLPTAATDHLAAMKAHPEVDIVMGSNQLIDPEDRVIGMNQLAARSYGLRDAALGFTPSFSQCMYRRCALERVGDFDDIGGRAADHELNLAILGSGKGGYCHGETVMQYRLHPGQQTKSPTQLYLSVDGVMERVFGPGGDHADTALRRKIRKHWQRYYGQFIPMEIYRMIRAGRWSEAGTALRIYVAGFPQSVLGTLRFLRRKLVG